MQERKRPTMKVRAKKEREKFHVIPYGRNVPGAVSYGSTVKLLSVFEKEEHIIEIKDYHYYARMDIPPVHALILNKRKGEIVNWNEFTYQILQIA